VNDDDEEMTTNIHTLSGIQTHGLSFQAIKAQFDQLFLLSYFV
jgi:hypothetical protein